MHDVCGNPVKERIVESITSLVYGDPQIVKMAAKILTEELSTSKSADARTRSLEFK